MYTYEKKYREANDKVAARFGTNVAKEIFTDLYESEDERTRKEIIKYIEGTFPNESSGIESKNKWIAWLEKQGEQKPTIEMISAEESLGIDSETYKKIVDECIYGDDKQKLAWGEEDEKMVANLVDYFKVDDALQYTEKQVVDRLKSLKNRVISQPKSTWSEEDQNALEDVREAIVHYWGGDTQDILLYWLKSLKQRIAP